MTNHFCSIKRLVFCVAALVMLGCQPACEAQDPNRPSPSPQASAAVRPVILLTGFEPFGERRPLNSSWEGIAPLEGQPWHEYTLVAKKMKVVWGAPLEQLQKWISEYHPVAVFSFGQGSSGHFSLESRAFNRRGSGLDNNDAAPPSPTITDDGPETFEASIDCQRLSRALSQKGYPIRVSTDAGRYLCEEALYSLEYLKTSNPLRTVLFCHVPPLDTTVNDRTVNASYVEQFVKDTLEAWYTIDSAKQASPENAAPGATAEDPRSAEVEELIRRYFRTWSEQDMKGYGDCFLPNASIQFLDSDGELQHFHLAPFLASQRDAHRRAEYRQTEVPESIEIRLEAKLARAVVYWKLTAGSFTEWGYDHFTLVKYQGHWRIVNLVFYATKRSG